MTVRSRRRRAAGLPPWNELSMDIRKKNLILAILLGLLALVLYLLTLYNVFGPLGSGAQ